MNFKPKTLTSCAKCLWDFQECSRPVSISSNLLAVSTGCFSYQGGQVMKKSVLILDILLTTAQEQFQHLLQVGHILIFNVFFYWFVHSVNFLNNHVQESASV
jgi:hypothetical protein